MVIKLFRIIALIFLLNLKYDYYILPTRRDEFVITSIWHLKWIRFSLLRQGWKTTLGRIHFITYLHLVISYWTIAYFTQCLTKIIHQFNKCKQVLCMIGFTYFTFKCLWYNFYTIRRTTQKLEGFSERLTLLISIWCSCTKT